MHCLQIQSLTLILVGIKKNGNMKFVELYTSYELRRKSFLIIETISID